MSQTLDQLNTVLANISTQRASVALQLNQLQDQLKNLPTQIQAQIAKTTKMGEEMDAVIAAIQVVITDEQLLEQTTTQVQANLSSPSVAAGSGPAADEQSATGSAAAGSAGVAGLADQPAAAASGSVGAADGTPEVAA